MRIKYIKYIHALKGADIKKYLSIKINFTLRQKIREYFRNSNVFHYFFRSV